jgi:hypothetical protein
MNMIMSKTKHRLITLFLAVASIYIFTGQANLPNAIQDGGTITVSGGVIGFPGYQTVNMTFEEKITGAPATVSVIITGCMRGGTCDTLDTYTTVANANRAVAGTYDSYQVTATWTGGTAPTVVVNRVAFLARKVSPGTGGGGGPSGTYLPEVYANAKAATDDCVNKGGGTIYFSVPGKIYDGPTTGTWNIGIVGAGTVKTPCVAQVNPASQLRLNQTDGSIGIAPGDGSCLQGGGGWNNSNAAGGNMPPKIILATNAKLYAVTAPLSLDGSQQTFCFHDLVIQGNATAIVYRAVILESGVYSGTTLYNYTVQNFNDTILHAITNPSATSVVISPTSVTRTGSVSTLATVVVPSGFWVDRDNTKIWTNGLGCGQRCGRVVMAGCSDATFNGTKNIVQYVDRNTFIYDTGSTGAATPTTCTYNADTVSAITSVNSLSNGILNCGSGSTDCNPMAMFSVGGAVSAWMGGMNMEAASVLTSQAVTSCSEDAGRTTSTCVTTAAHKLHLGQFFKLTGVVDTTFNSDPAHVTNPPDWIVNAITDNTHFSFANTSPGISATSTGGTLQPDTCEIEVNGQGSSAAATGGNTVLKTGFDKQHVEVNGSTDRNNNGMCVINAHDIWANGFDTSTAGNAVLAVGQIGNTNRVYSIAHGGFSPIGAGGAQWTYNAYDYTNDPMNGQAGRGYTDSSIPMLVLGGLGPNAPYCTNVFGTSSCGMVTLNRARVGVFNSLYNCAVGGVNGQATPAACGGAASGVLAIPLSAVSPYVVNTTQVNASSMIYVQQISDNSNIPGAPACTATLTNPVQSARVNGTSFSFAFTTTAAVMCYKWWIVNAN